MKINIAIAGPVGNAITQVLSLTAEHQFTNFDEATLVVVQGKEGLEKLHRRGKFFAVLSPRNPGELPSNAKWFKLATEMSGLMNFVMDETAINERLGVYAATTNDSHEVPIECTGTGKRRILVIDDTVEHRTSAKEALKDECLTIASSYGQAMELLRHERFDVVLTDLYLPMSRYHSALSAEALEIDTLVPYGILIALQAAQQGVDSAVVTDANHHRDCFSAAFDDRRRHPYKLQSNAVLLLINDCGKDWGKALARLLLLKHG